MQPVPTKTTTFGHALLHLLRRNSPSEQFRPEATEPEQPRDYVTLRGLSTAANQMSDAGIH